jgi:hypothetical protein
MKPRNIISDSSPLIAFHKKNELDLLKLLFNKLIIPQAVYDELTSGNNFKNQQKRLKKAIEEGWIIVKKLKEFKLPDLNLGKGEKQAINLCLELKNSLLLIDEKKGSSIAKTFGINTLGTLGILLLIKKKKIKSKDQIFENLNNLLKENFYLSSEVITLFLKKIKI